MRELSSVKPWKTPVAAILIGLLLVFTISQTSVDAFGIPPPPSDLNRGPFVDKLVYKVIANHDQRYLALKSGEIVMDTSFFDYHLLPTLAEDTDIDIFSALRNGYGHITINTRD